jgi:hypothetical protein
MIRQSFVILALTLALAFTAPITASAKSASGSATMPSCPTGDPVVWVNTATHVYHAKGDKYFGNTKAGTYACTSKATAMGAHLSGSGTSVKSTKDAPVADETPAAAATKKPKHHRSSMASPAP